MRSLSTSAILVVCVLLFSGTAMAKVLIPTNLNQTDREDALRILGFGTSSKILSNPYPMGGYPGFEIGVSVESLPTDDLGRLGDGLETPQQDVSYAKISIGKGLYHGFDVFFQFSPFNQKDGLSQYGGILRWCFFEAESFPLSLSALVHYNSANFDNLVITRSYGADLIAGINVDNVALYGGFGNMEANGEFAVGPVGVTESKKPESTFVTGFHTVVGASVSAFDTAFIALEIDRYTAPVFSGKIGVRF